MGAIGDEHQRKVVAQPSEVAITRERRRAKAESVDRVETFALSSPGGEEQALFGKGKCHVHCGLPREGSHHATRRDCESFSGHTVNLSSSASKPERICSVVRIWPALRKS